MLDGLAEEPKPTAPDSSSRAASNAAMDSAAGDGGGGGVGGGLPVGCALPLTSRVRLVAKALLMYADWYSLDGAGGLPAAFFRLTAGRSGSANEDGDGKEARGGGGGLVDV